MTLDPQAAELNAAISDANPHVHGLLSKRGKAIYFPKLGILSQSAEARGRAINATIGTALEDNGSSMCLETLHKMINMEEKSIFSYAPSYGRPEMRTLWKNTLLKKNPSLASITISQPVVTSALTHGLSMAGYLFADAGDTIVLPDLYWENYDLVFDHAYGASLAPFPMFGEKGGFNVQGLTNALAGPAGKKIVLLNFPNNPTGYTPTVKEAQEICNALLAAAEKGSDIVVFVDDAYFGLVYENGIMTESIFPMIANLHERILAVKFDGPTKEDYVWGFRIGFVTFGAKKNSPAMYTALEAKLAGAIRGNISNASNLGQSLLLAAYEDVHYADEKIEKYAILKRRFERVKLVLKSHPEYAKAFTALPFNSGYFMCVKLRRGSAEPVRQALLSKYSTGVIAQGDLIRVAFSSTPLDLIEKLFDNMYQACCDAAS